MLLGYVQSWAVEQMLVKAADAGDFSRRGIRDALRRVGTLDLKGLISDYEYGTDATKRDPPRATTIFAVTPSVPAD
jgi:hypothetical protein